MLQVISQKQTTSYKQMTVTSQVMAQAGKHSGNAQNGLHHFSVISKRSQICGFKLWDTFHKGWSSVLSAKRGNKGSTERPLLGT